MTDALIRGADDRGLTVRTPRAPAARGGMVCLDFPRAREVCARLVAGDVIVDWRPDCGVRVSPHFYSTDDDLAAFWAALDAAIA